MNASLKVPEGKMVKVKTEVEDGKLKDPEIRGDFFIEPAEKLHELEEKVSGTSIDFKVDDMVESLEEVDAELIGFSAEHVAEAFKKAVEGENR